MHCLDIRIDTYKKNEILETIKRILATQKQYLLFTPNPEMLVDAQTDHYFKEVLNNGDINVCDGKGIQLWSKGRIPRITGVDLMQDICALAENEWKSVYLLGSGDDDVLKKTKVYLQEKYPNLRIAGVHKGPQLKEEGERLIYLNPTEQDAVLEDIILSAPDILFVAFGHKKQEKWMYEHLPSLPSVKVAMGIGGTFDFLSGKQVRAPKIVRILGFEWLWRLIRQPSRWKRIWKAFVVFSSLCIKEKITK
ncbi:WecB/TagA/CpsF family glycosyltransferase [Patescibacteria group bacterium]|nr:WecB/TagA/CpsF family glycosyltransferase [Patescibacteria group bacterium]MBU1721807.1 WecB/TagA/CpsF family glycosyltransferase [Patescibacteria group bacterium]MBU1900841.1 WecB/TagA/CpsF family glycosyltransferase [Patescibacteria group bacterium]